MFVRLLALGCLSLTLVGCGSGGVGSVSGTVTVSGKPLPNGQVRFYGEGDKQAAGAVSKGAYTINNAPLGPVKIAVLSFAESAPVVVPGKEPPPKPAAPPAPAMQLSEKYANPQTSGLTYTVVPGSQTHDIQITELFKGP